ncbi:N-acetyl-gamma-glutamyl-phosphate reductase [Haliovirga abyssi]|uniref:N-acetyl-gamma-glutamyl-phosphate reductase n=1 Tax=Haliovirga abyssi TaxID=2996794 RepID=A0AAU9DS74_9FUSO|nr:N-acetyl-gamma-glutamyl-phosphate reductase [Haliovirga abyssi]BDU51463.1 N-acetyl-gamma-glutamyl-phosphate reductase [Haliovirga abyssi]
MKVSIVGGSGYTGIELIRILLNHPKVEIDKIVSESNKGKKVSELFQNLKNIFEKEFIGVSNLEVELKDSEYIFLAVPHKAAMEYVPMLLKMGKKVIDLSADFRIDDFEVYEQWYKENHVAKEYLEEAVYGLPELNREKIKKARLVANPGCYPTTVILGLAPLLSEKLIDINTIISDSKSGVSGAGKKCTATTHFSETNENFKAYGIASHRHTPEIEQELSKLAKKDIIISFTPHLIPMTRGMLSTIYSNLISEQTEEEIVELYKTFYKNEKFVRIVEVVQTKNVRGSNFIDIAVKLDKRTNRIIVTSAIDNITKGASGQAIQNFNIMAGFNEMEGLNLIGYLP